MGKSQFQKKFDEELSSGSANGASFSRNWREPSWQQSGNRLYPSAFRRLVEGLCHLSIAAIDEDRAVLIIPHGQAVAVE